MSKVPLHYEAQTPAFLRRLKAGFSESDGRNNIQHARPNKSRLKTSADDPEEDEPLIIDESGEVVDKKEWQSRLNSDKKTEEVSEKVIGDGTDKDRSDTIDTSAEREHQKVLGVGEASKKRKVGKVVGGEAEEDRDEDSSTPVKSISKATSDLKSIVKDSKDAAKKDAETQKTKSQTSKADGGSSDKKKKVKKVKLSFDEPE